ncbi:hypothetical protein D3C77_476230 [compost metagenome]
MGGGLEEHRRLAANHFHVDGFGGAGVANFRQLQHFAFGDHAGRLGNDAHHRHRAEFDHHFERAGIEEVAHQYARRIAPESIGRRAAATHAGHVDHVVVQQRGGVQEFDDRRKQTQLIALMPQRAAAEQHEQGAQTLAARRGDIVPDLFHQRNARGQLLANDAVDSGKIVGHYLVERLGLHQGLLADCAACYEPALALSRRAPPGLASPLSRAYNRGP